ncbi:MAG: OmpH family outer membrane protein [Bacteroidia bacterium]|nr:OmpH family outer membrane protein [Bacteroidia bacterium]
MRNLVKFIIVITLVFSVYSVFSQGKMKFGHINSSELVKMMPERDSAQKSLQSYGKELEDQLSTMQAELESKYSDFTKQEPTMNEVVKATRQKELQDLNTRIEEFKSSAQDNYQKKQTELLQPIIDKANKAIQDVGKEKGFFYIFDVSAGAVVYFSTDSEDVMPLVKTKLGIK